MLKLLSEKRYIPAAYCILHIQKVLAHAGIEKLPRITLPHRMVQKLEKEKLKNLLKKHKKPYVLKTNENLVITCKNKEYNHYKNQYYPDFSNNDLASHGWKHYKSKGDHFTINPFQKNPALRSEEESFRELKVQEVIVEALKDIAITKPTNIQSLVIPQLLKGENVLYAAETGNGKTLAYLIPIIEKVLRLQRCEERGSSRLRLNKPVAVVVAPSRELVQQIYDVANALAGKLNFSVDMKVGGHGTKRILREMEVKPIDILISTPGILSKLLSNRFFDLRHLSYSILDEADTLFDDSFCDLSVQIIKKMKISVEKPVSVKLEKQERVVGKEEMVGWLDEYEAEKEEEEEEVEGGGVGEGMQVVMCGATMPLDMRRKLAEIIDMDAMQVLTTRHLHFISPHITHKFVRLGAAQKLDHLTQLLKQNEERNIRTIVFCNKPSTIYFILHSLEHLHLSLTSLHSQLPVPLRDGRFEAFKLGRFNAILCTDIASRGLDTVEAQHVINYDFPNFTSDYVHRVGRVGRVGSVGGSVVINFVTHAWDVEMVWKIEEAVRLKSELPNVNANIKRKLVAMAAVKKMQQELLEDPPQL